MAEMDEHDFADMVEQTSVDTYVIEYREPSVDGQPGRLIGACLSDQQSDGLCMIYSFFDVGPDSRKGLGTFIILDHVIRAGRAGLPYVYLGYWVEGSERMQYKTALSPARAPGPRRLAADGRARARGDPHAAAADPHSSNRLIASGEARRRALTPTP